ncbi:MAG: DUF2085 domain-containing protein [Chloroflexota bacterium]
MLSATSAFFVMQNAAKHPSHRPLLWITRNWLAIVNTFLLAFAGLPVLTPLVRADGMTGSADAIAQAYSLVCHQMPSRSYFLLGYQMAYCERDTAIYAAMALSGLLWARYHRRLPRLHWSLFLLLILPMALDGSSQLFGLRESTWELRTITGALFGLACVWFGFPLLATSLKLIRIALRASVSRRELAPVPA